jgi:hypothetical protein
VIVTSYDLGMNTDGGLGNLLASLRIAVVTRKSEYERGYDITAGLTAGMSVRSLKR